MVRNSELGSILDYTFYSSVMISLSLGWVWGRSSKMYRSFLHMIIAYFLLKKKKKSRYFRNVPIKNTVQIDLKFFWFDSTLCTTSVDMVVIFLLIKGANSDSKNKITINSKIIIDNVNK